MLDARLVATLRERDPGNGNDALLRYDPATARSEVGIVALGSLEASRARYALVDARTGANAGPVDRVWDDPTEGNP